MKELSDADEPVVAQALLNLVESGYRIINPAGDDVTEDVRIHAVSKLNKENE